MASVFQSIMKSVEVIKRKQKGSRIKGEGGRKDGGNEGVREGKQGRKEGRREGGKGGELTCN